MKRVHAAARAARNVGRLIRLVMATADHVRTHTLMNGLPWSRNLMSLKLSKRSVRGRKRKMCNVWTF
jgi:hypothetical protein